MIFEAVYFSLAWLGGQGIAAVILILLIALAFLGQQGKIISRQTAPALMTSLGIFGTFCGIFVALSELDFANDNENGFTEFLDGMKTAFVTSLFGIAFAIVSRAFWSRPGAGEKSRHPEQHEILDKLDAIKHAIAGDGDSSMVTQMRAMRDENRVGFEKLDGLSETIRVALVENLQELMKDIRNVIGKQLEELVKEIREVMVDQLGKTFTELKNAVVALNKWQENHRTQVERLTEAFDLVAKKIVVIAKNCENIPVTMEKLRKIIESAHGDVEKLNSQLKEFAAMHEQARGALPAIQKYLNKVLGDLENSAKGFEGLEETIRNTFKDAAEEHMRSVKEMVANLNGELKRAQAESSNEVMRVVKQAIDTFDSQMNEEINKVTLKWGANLVAIAEDAEKAIRAAKKQGES